MHFLSKDLVMIGTPSLHFGVIKNISRRRLIPFNIAAQAVTQCFEDEVMIGRIMHHSLAFGRSSDVMSNSTTEFALTQIRGRRLMIERPNMFIINRFSCSFIRL